MKKFVLISVLMSLLLSAWAQSSPNYILNDQTSKAFDVYAGTATRFVAEENGNLLVTSRSFKNLFVARVQDDIMVRWVDKSLNVKQEFVLEGSRSYDLLTASMADDEVVLLVKYWEKKQLVVKRVILDKATLQAKGEEVLYTHEEPIMGLDLCWTAVSEDGSFTALMALTAGYAYFNQPTWLRRGLLFALSIPIAVAGNATRILSIVAIAATCSADFATGFYHDYSGYIVFLVAISLMVATGGLISKGAEKCARS